MKWDSGHKSPDVEDRRGAGGAGGGGGGGLIWLLLLILRSPLGWVGVVIAVGAYLVLGGFSSLMGDAGVGPTDQGAPVASGPDSPMVHFVSFVLDDAQATWKQKLAERGAAYRNAKLVLFEGRTRSGCGAGSAATGPFYCPADERVYIDLSFFRELARRFGAPGDFAQAYVVAHEIGHHVQNQLGISDRVHRAPRAELEGASGLSVRLELQADCFAGVWGNATQRRDILDKGDIEEALAAAAAIGDDRLQRQAEGTVTPESWTHGSSEQRVRWFKRGFAEGKMEACDTFAASAL